MVERALIREALAALGVEQLVLGVHDASFPGEDDEDPGRGSPYSRGAARLFELAAALGFDGIQLGPQGATHAGSASPYEATLFSRNPLNLPPRRLAELGLVEERRIDELVRQRPEGTRRRMSYRYAFDAYHPLLADAASRALEHDRWQRRAEEFLQANRTWLVPDALYDVLCAVHRRPYWREWGHTELGRFDLRLFHPAPGDEERAAARLALLEAAHAPALRQYALLQSLLHEEHHALRRRLEPLGLSLYGDLQVGFSAKDSWAYQGLFLDGYQMGAPPSRTNPDGQPWGYSVLDPGRYGSQLAPGPALAFVHARVDHLLEGVDGVRIDHPHGWIDPWVYRADDPDALHAVQTGTRLFSSPGVQGHPRIGAFAVARPEQLNAGAARHADDWVRFLEDEQVARYSILVDAIVERAKARGRDLRRVVCEVLSTMPYPVARVLQRHGLGRFRVMQKAKLDDPTDVYRTAQAQPPDWIMLGNHDTPPIWQVVDRWAERGELRARAEDLATRVTPNGQSPERFAAELAKDRSLLIHALLADAFCSRARNIYVFFSDLFGQREAYNSPGTVSDENWSLRVPLDFEEAVALDVPAALAIALRARGGEAELRLAAALERQAGAP